MAKADPLAAFDAAVAGEVTPTPAKATKGKVDPLAAFDAAVTAAPAKPATSGAPTSFDDALQSAARRIAGVEPPTPAPAPTPAPSARPVRQPQPPPRVLNGGRPPIDAADRRPGFIRSLVTGYGEALQQTGKDVGGAVVSMGEGLFSVPVDALTRFDNIVGETARGTSRYIHGRAAETREIIGARKNSFGTETGPQVLGASLTLVRGTQALSGTLSRLPQIKKLYDVAAAGSKTAAAVVNVIEGQIATALLTYADARRDKPMWEMALDAAKWDLGLSAAGAAPWAVSKLVNKVPEEVRARVSSAVVTNPVVKRLARTFRWLGTRPQSVRDSMDRYYATLSTAETESETIAKEISSIEDVGQRKQAGGIMRGNVTTDRVQAEIDDAARQAWSDADAQIKATNADSSLSREQRQQKIRSLRETQRNIIRTADPQEGTTLAKIQRASRVLNEESEAFRLRQQVDAVRHVADKIATVEKQIQTARQVSPGRIPRLEKRLAGLQKDLEIYKEHPEKATTYYYDKLTRAERTALRDERVKKSRDSMRSLGLDVDLVRVRDQIEGLKQEIERSRDFPQERLVMQRQLERAMRKNKMLSEVFEGAGMNPDRVVSGFKGQFDDLAARRGQLDTQLTETRRAMRGAVDDAQVTNAALDRAKRPLTPEQRKTVESADYFASIEAKRAGGYASAYANRAGSQDAKNLRDLVKEQGKGTRELINEMERDLKMTDEERIATLTDRLITARGTIRKSSAALKDLQRDRDAVAREIAEMQKTTQFPGRGARIRELLEMQRDINESLRIHYRFGGNENYMPRMYLSKAEKAKLGAMLPPVAVGPRINRDLRHSRDPFLPERLAEEKAVLEVRLPKVDEEIAGYEAEMSMAETASDSNFWQRAIDRATEQRARMTGRLAKIKNDEILDPTFPVAQRVRELIDDRAAWELFNDLARNPEAVRFGEAAPSADWEQVTGKSWGMLDGAWVHKDLLPELRSIQGISSKVERFYNAFIRVWKVNKTALNPATHGRNIMGNTLMLDFGGVPLHEQGAAMNRATTDLMELTERGQRFRRSGLSLGTFTHADLRTFAGVTEAGDEAERMWIEKLADAYLNAPVVRQMTRVYAAEDEVARMTLFNKALDVGLNDVEATRYVDRYLPNYRHIPKNPVTKFFGAWQPFYAFTYTAAPIMVKNAIEQPAKMAKWFAMGRALTTLSGQMLGLRDEDLEGIHDVMPEYARASDIFWPTLTPLLPAKDENGNYMVLDLTNAFPLGNMFDGAETPMATIANLFSLSNPAANSVYELTFNRQRFNDRPIYKSESFADATTNPQDMKRIASYLWKQGMPSIAGWGLDRIERGIRYELDAHDPQARDGGGKVQPLEFAVADAVAGVKTYAVKPQEEKGKRLRQLSYEIGQAEREKIRIRKQKGKSADDIAAELKEQDEIVARLREQRKAIAGITFSERVEGGGE